MVWYDLRDPKDPQLDQLAERYNLHPLHIEDCRNRNQSAKVEFVRDYIFAVLKPIEMDAECVINATDLDIFAGPDYVITVQESHCANLTQILDRLHETETKLTPAELFHRVIDAVVDMYHPVTDQLSDKIDSLEELALKAPQVSTIERLFDLRRALIELRRILANTRDLVSHILRTEHPQLTRELQPFFRDVYDHAARALDIVDVLRDLVNGATELYLSSVANQTNQVMKVLTVFGTVATPAIVITGIYGMNVKHLPFAESPHSWGIVMTMIALVSVLMLAIFRKMRWL